MGPPGVCYYCCFCCWDRSGKTTSNRGGGNVGVGVGEVSFQCFFFLFDRIFVGVVRAAGITEPDMEVVEVGDDEGGDDAGVEVENSRVRLPSPISAS